MSDFHAVGERIFISGALNSKIHDLVSAQQQHIC